MFSYLGKGRLRPSTYASSFTSSASSHVRSDLGLGQDIGTETRFEAWALKRDPHQQTRVPLPGLWLGKHATKICPSKSLLKRFSFLHPDYKTHINKLIEEKNAEERRHGWFLVSLQSVNKILRENLLRRHELEVCVLIVLGRLLTKSEFKDSDSLVSSISSRQERGDLPPQNASSNEGITRSSRTQTSDPPAGSLDPSSAPPPPPPRTSFSILPQPQPPPAGNSGIGASYHGSTIPSRAQSSYRSLGPKNTEIIELTRPSGRIVQFPENRPRPATRIYNTDIDDSRPHVSFGANERESMTYTSRRPRPYGSASAAGRSGPTATDGVDRPGINELLVYNEDWPSDRDNLRAASTLPPDDWRFHQMPSYHRPSYYDRENEIGGFRPAVHSEYENWYSPARHRTSRDPWSFGYGRDESQFGSILSASVKNENRKAQPSGTPWERPRGQANGTKHLPHAEVTEPLSKSDKTPNTPSGRPTWIKMSRRHVSLTTLQEFKLPWRFQAVCCIVSHDIQFF